MDLFFSVIIPAYNSASFVSEAIESALNQEDVEFEVIVVNDGSTDATLEVVQRFAEKIRIVDQCNMGLSGARNSGAKAAKGNVLAFLDADDIWFQGKLKAQSLKIKQGFAVVYTNRMNFGELGDLPEIQSEVVTMTEGFIWENILFGNMITASSSVIMKEVFDNLGGFRVDLRSCEDWDLWLRCSQHHKIGYCSEPLIKYRIHAGGLSKNYVFMSEMRQIVLESALQTVLGKQLSKNKRRQIVSRSWANSGWDAACGKDLVQALRCYGISLCQWPFSSSIWYDLARVVAGRV